MSERAAEAQRYIAPNRLLRILADVQTRVLGAQRQPQGSYRDLLTAELFSLRLDLCLLLFHRVQQNDRDPVVFYTLDLPTCVIRYQQRVDLFLDLASSVFFMAAGAEKQITESKIR